MKLKPYFRFLNRSKLKRASLSKLALFLLISTSFCTQGVASAQSVAEEKALIEKGSVDISARVEKLLGEKKKKEAINLLVASLQGSGKVNLKTQAIKNFSLQQQNNYELYLRLSRAFETDRAQQIYELAMASKKSNPALALQKIEEAVLVEPTQQLLILEKIRMTIAKKDCLAAEPLLEPLKAKYFFDEEILLLSLQQQLCLQKPIEGQLILLKKQVPLIKAEWLWLSLSIQQKLQAKQWVTSFEEIERLKKIDGAYPEVFYFEWVIGYQTKNYRMSTAQKYQKKCEELTGFVYRKYNLDPLLCQRVAEVIEDLNNLKKKQAG
jgi:hypothetical protein